MKVIPFTANYYSSAKIQAQEAFNPNVTQEKLLNEEFQASTSFDQESHLVASKINTNNGKIKFLLLDKQKNKIAEDYFDYKYNKLLTGETLVEIYNKLKKLVVKK